MEGCSFNYGRCGLYSLMYSIELCTILLKIRHTLIGWKRINHSTSLYNFSSVSKQVYYSKENNSMLMKQGQ